jgi:DNA repair exonuclease SbcCD ATPase subunit
VKIVQFEAENIKKLKVVNIKPDGSLIQITGGNGQGKSSVLDAIYWALAGTAGIQSEPVRKGTQKAHVKLDLGEVTVIRRFVEGGGTSLNVEAQNGARFPSPQKMLDDLMGKLAFDPLAFTRMGAKEQLETLRSLVKLEIDIDELDRANKLDFDARTETNRRVKALTAQRDGILVQQGLPEKPVDVTALVAKLEKAATHNGEVQREQYRRESDLQSLKNDRERVAQLRAEADELEKENDRLAKQIEKLPPIKEPIDTKLVAKEIEEGRAVNAAILVRQERARIQSDLNDAERDAKEFTAAIEKRNKERADAIGKAKMPLETLSFGDGHVIYNGLPFEQASDAEQLRVSVAIAMAANPKLRVLRIKDGSLLDEKSLKVVSDMADKADYQVWIERVDTSGKVGIVMEDGAVVEAASAPEQPQADTKKKESKKK